MKYTPGELDCGHEWKRTVAQASSDGQKLFMNNCARCHTRGWSYFDPLHPRRSWRKGLMGGGTYGPNLGGAAM